MGEGRDRYVVHDVAYKPSCPVPIVEESQTLAIAVAIAQAGKSVTIVDRDFIVAKVSHLVLMLRSLLINNDNTHATPARTHSYTRTQQSTLSLSDQQNLANALIITSHSTLLLRVQVKEEYGSLFDYHVVESFGTGVFDPYEVVASGASSPRMLPRQDDLHSRSECKAMTGSTPGSPKRV